MWKSFAKFDLFEKTDDEVRVRTGCGGFLSLCSCLIIVFLSLAEFNYYLAVKRVDNLVVDHSSKSDRLPVYLNITFLAIPCEGLKIDIMDISGDHQEDVEHLFFKQRLSMDGKKLHTKEKGEMGETSFPVSEELLAIKDKVEAYKKKAADPSYCGSCYTGQAEKCCNTCEEVENAYMDLGWAFRLDDKIEQCMERGLKRKTSLSRNEGCRIEGEFLVKKVAGNFHFAPGRSSHSVNQHVHEYTSFEVDHFNASHRIESLGFGEKYPGIINPLDGTTKICIKNSGLYQYFIKVVPTSYEFYGSRNTLVTNQFAVTEHFRERKTGTSVIPGIYFLYDLSPIMVDIKEYRTSFFHFLTSLCAILGGVIVISQLFDGILYSFRRGKVDESGRNTILK